MPTTTIAHLTDPHLSSLAGVGLGSLMSKRALGYLSWRRKRRHRHTLTMLEATTAAVLDHNPDALVITGDLLHIGLASEMRQVRAWIKRLADRLPVLLVPGNHDLYAADSGGFWEAELGDLPVFGKQADAEQAWPRLMQVNNIRVIGLSSAYPAPFTRADGCLGTQQQRVLATLLAESADATLLALHHPADSTLCARRKSLLDAAELQALINEHGADALVHGHLHRNIKYAVGATPCFCTASASSVHGSALASYRLLEFQETGMRSRLFVASGVGTVRFLETPPAPSTRGTPD